MKLAIEQLGSNGRRAYQTPLATGHAFNGWADRFLTTPADGLQDRYLGWKHGWGGWQAGVFVHDFRADRGDADYGSEWDASLGFKLGPVALLAKYANYDAGAFAASDR